MAHVALDVSDVQRSRDWYCRVLGFEVVQDGESRVGLFHREGRLGLALASSDRVIPGERAGRVLDHIAFYVPNRAGLDEWVDRLAELGVDAAVEEAGGGWSVSAFDPDGNEMELFTPARPPASPDAPLSVDTTNTKP